jgi:hypothetical protein
VKSGRILPPLARVSSNSHLHAVSFER